MTQLSTHVLDTARGIPAQGVPIELYAITGDTKNLVVSATTNKDGRTDAPLLSENSLGTGTYEINFFVAEYFRHSGHSPTEAAPFLDIVPVRFTISAHEKNYHVPLLVTPWSYSTYRGS